MTSWLTEAWPLFGDTYLVAWFLAIVLSLTGLPVVARDQVLLGVGLVQAGAVGLAVSLMTVPAAACACHASSGGGTSPALVAVILAAIFAAHPPPRERHEAIAGWLVLAGSAAVLVLLARHPLGLEAVNRLQASSLIGAQPRDPWWAGGFAVTALATCLLLGRRLLLTTWDRRFAASQGLPVTWITLSLAVWTGLVIALGLRQAGVLFTAGLLVLPALIARRLVRRLAYWPWLTMVIALVAVSVALAISWHADLPPGQMAVAVLAMGLALVWMVQWLVGFWFRLGRPST